MKHVCTLLFSTVFLSLFFFLSCSSKRIQVDLDTVTSDTTLRVSLGSEIKVSVYENMTTGYMWSTTGANSSVELLKEEYKSEKQPKFIVGAGNTKIYIFKATKSGECKLSFTYSRSWEPNSGHTKNILVTVE